MDRPVSLIAAARTTALGTLGSRITGLLRDMATAAVLGMSGGGVLDAFVVAFRIPNLARRLLGEGALTAAFVPVFARELDRDRRRAGQVAAATFALSAVVLAAGVTVAWLGLGAAYLLWGGRPGVDLLLGLAAAMMPYALFVCLAAQSAAVLQALGRFALPAAAPMVLNLCWLAAAIAIAPRVRPEGGGRAFVLAGAVLVAGVVQLGLQWAAVRRAGLRPALDFGAVRQPVSEVFRGLAPVAAALAVTQLNALADSLIAWGLAGPATATIGWLPGEVGYPMRPGAAGAIYFGERLYQFPLGLVGVAVATAVFPTVARRAARGEGELLGSDIATGLRLVLAVALPAAAGLVLLGEPLVGLLFERGLFTAHDTARAARVVAFYGSGVWAYCALPVVVRGFYAIGERRAPARLGLAAVGLNLALNATLIWPLAEAGLAAATSATAALQLAVLLAVFAARIPLPWGSLATTAARAAAATAVMAVACLLLEPWLRGQVPASPAVQLAVLLAVAGGLYLAAYRILGGREIGWLLRG